MGGRSNIDDLLKVARARIERAGPAAARTAQERGALLVDIRSSEQRAAQGIIPGSIWIERNVLEWRLDPESGATDPRFGRLDAELILLCAEGYCSSLAAETLARLGFERVGDLEGGFKAWAAAGLPVEPLDRR